MLYLMLWLYLSRQIVSVQVSTAYAMNNGCKQNVEYAFIQTDAGLVGVVSPDAISKYYPTVEAVKLTPGCME